MKVPPSTPEKPAAAKSQPLVVPRPEPGPRRSEEVEYTPRYVALPRQWERGHGRRNLVGGVVVLVVAVLFLGWALWLAGPGAIFIVAACLATATLLHVMARSRLFRQRNGAFVAWSGVCLLGVVLVILHHGWVSLTGGSRSRPAGQEAATVAAAGETPLLRDAFPQRSEVVSGPTMRVVRDTKVSIEGKPYLAKQGEVYPLVDLGVDEHGQSVLRFSVGLHDALIAKGAGEVVANDAVPGLDGAAPPGKPAAIPLTGGEAPATSAAESKEFQLPKGVSKQEQEVAAHKEAMRRYPDLGRVGSFKNQTFISAYKEQQHVAKEFFDDPGWPLTLAEILAEKEGWKRADLAESERRPLEQPPAEPVRRPRP
ncbi:MAG TPA: hypothetical protein VGO11_09870 [Chthoniobacteraceae bacterium]|nr:hypothetical protein [Chthoniobacteraceae bacterium]